MEGHYEVRVSKVTPLLRQVFVVGGAAVNIVGHGCIHAFPAVLFDQLKHPEVQIYPEVNSSTSGLNVTSTNTPGLVISQAQISWIVSIMIVLGVLGGLLCPVFMKRYGRQKIHLFTTIPALLGWIAVFVAQDFATLLLARLLHGLAVGVRTPLAAILVAEYASPEYRGAFLGTFAIALGLGILITHLVGSYLTWKMTAVVCSVFPLIAMVIIGFSPESPSWLAAKGKFDSCSEVFLWLRGNSDEQKKELRVLITSQELERKASQKNIKVSFTESCLKVMHIFRKKEFFKPTIIAACMFFIFEFGGAHLVPAYANIIIPDILGKSPKENVHWQIATADFLRMVSAFIAIVLIQKFNRRTILIVSGTMTVLSFILISSYMYIRKFQLISTSALDSYVPMCLLVFYVLSFCLGLLPLTWVLCGEIFPLAYRSLGSTISGLSLIPAFMLSMKTAPRLFSSIGVEGAYLVYAVVLVICLVTIYYLLPETRGRTLEEIAYSFSGKRISSDIRDDELRMLKK